MIVVVGLTFGVWCGIARGRVSAIARGGVVVVVVIVGARRVVVVVRDTPGRAWLVLRPYLP